MPVAASAERRLKLLWTLFALCSLLIYLPALIMWLRIRVATGSGWLFADRDFINYWVGAQLARAGDLPTLFSYEAYYGHLQSLFGQGYPIHSWSYPPHYLFFIWPLSFLSFETALVAFETVTFALFVWSARRFQLRFSPELSPAWMAIAVFGFTLMMLATTQNGFLTAAAALLALSCMRERPLLAGLAIACLTIKPQTGLLLPVLLAMDRNWRAIGWSALFTVVLIGASAAVFGVGAWRDYFTDIVPYQQRVMFEWNGSFLLLMPNVFGSMRALKFLPEFALQVQTLVSAAVLVWCIVMWRRLTDPLDRAGVLLIGTFLGSPYSFAYDMGAMCVAAALLALRRARAGDTARALALGTAAIVPGVMLELGKSGLPVTPLVLLGALYALSTLPRAALTPGEH